ncbi:DNA cytosine methyltransferase [Verrucomicrobium spinosum]|uniref:DNA cytosine methyltransferase n=3 Tax=Verrucomicrobium spinosum TaxID=2736 RepID=UPI00017468B4|nr:DNA cytosine methyltransferase [Verrucomicrobium spinosum]
MLSFPEVINSTLIPTDQAGLVAIDLFAGCGGLALGFESAGISTIGFEKDRDACASYRRNLGGECFETLLTPESQFPKCDLIIGGPPCQPFSVGGHQNGLKDSRDGFPTFISAVARLRPKLWMFENVRGMMYGNRWYLDQILAELRDLGYEVDLRILNSVHFGVPQKRERLVVVGHLGGFVFPAPSAKVWTSADALEGMLYATPPESRFLTPSMDKYIANYEKASACVRPRDLHLDLPARTLTCRNLAGATGDMQRIKLPDGRRRRLLPREAARLQSFPDGFEFIGSEGSVFTQIGNAVPPMMAYALAGSVVRYFKLKRHSVPRAGQKVAA